MADKENMQQKIIEYQLLMNQIKQMQQQMMTLDQQILELRKLEESLSEMAKVKLGTEIQIPLGSGIFIKGQLKENKEVLVNVGANTIVPKDIDSTKILITQQIGELNNIAKQIEGQIRDCAVRSQELQEELRNLEKK